MRRGILLVLAVGLMIDHTASALAQGPVRKFSRSVARDAKRNNSWPHPFVWPDRDAVWAPMTVMAMNGWRQQNTLTEHHFKDGTSQLNEAGRLKVQWILQTAPTQYRTVFVQRSLSHEATADRIAAVENMLAEVAVDGTPPAVLESTSPPTGWSADYAETIARMFGESTPAPRIPPVAGSGTPASSGSSQ